MFKYLIFIFSIFFSNSIFCSQAEMHLLFHMGIGANGKFEIGGTLENKGVSDIYRGYINYVVIDERCKPQLLNTYYFGMVQANSKLSFKIPIEGKLKGYRILDFGGIDSYGFPVKIVDETSEIIEKRIPKQREKCEEFTKKNK